ncbi:hypothetical protein B566_EDAN004997 [Ephemera danica]|nr:hypothetical protein B566_EDAN004997 [Ephemera danica]
MVRKFCLLQKPDGDQDSSTMSEHPPPTSTKKIPVTKPHKTLPEPISCPKFISQIRITESQTQTDSDLVLQSSTTDLGNMGINEESSALKRALLMGHEDVMDAKKRRLKENFNVLDKLIENPCANSNPLHIAVINNRTSAIVRQAMVLKAFGKSIDQRNRRGLAPLHMAVMADKMEHVSLLIKSANIDVNLPDVRSGRTPLFHASERKFLALARLILCSGGSKQVVNFAGQSVLTMSLESELLKGMESDEDSPPIKRRGKARK